MIDQTSRQQKSSKASWISQAAYSSKSNRSVERVRYLAGFRSLIRDRAQSYFRREPEGEQVTLACLQAIPMTEIELLSSEFKIAKRTVKQDLGILVPLVLLDLVGPDGVETYRHRESLKNSTRSCPKVFSKVSWVSRYTPHRLTQSGRLRLQSGPRTERVGDTPKVPPAKNKTLPVHLL